jgi:DMSO/TMAO reductase YedYZ molybdopterin-dependent catalytic subunit
MTLYELHWVPSTIAAILIILLAFVRGRGKHIALSFAMVFFATIGLVGFALEGDFNLLTLDIHGLHIWLGTAALALSLVNVAVAALLNRRLSEAGKARTAHCLIGYAAAVLACAALISGIALLAGSMSLAAPAGNQAVQVPLTNGSAMQTPPPNATTLQVPASNVLSAVEATRFMGANLTPISSQQNNAINGTQYINQSTYALRVTGLVNDSLNLSYARLLALPAYSEVASLPCIEGWNFTAQWTGFRVMDLLDMAGLKPGATYVVFYGADGYSTGLPLDYLRDQRVLMAYGLNNVTLPPDRGFPFQLVAVDKYGYKWAKWITRIDVVNETVEGYWESRGYSNSANVSK